MNPKYSRYYTYIKPILKNQAVQNYSSIVFSIITVVIFAMFAIRPTVGTIIGLQRSIQEQQQILDKLNAKSQALASGKRHYEELDPNLKTRIDNLLPIKTDLTILLDNLSSLTNGLEASISGIQIQPIDLIPAPTNLNRDAKLHEVDFTYNVQGGYTTFNELIKRIRSSKRLINVESVSISRSGDDGLIMSINAKSFFLAN